MPLHPTRRIGITIFIILIGGICFGILGEGIGVILPEGPVKTFFLKSLWVGFSPVTINLHLLSFTIGFHLKFNLMSVLGIVFFSYLLKWVY